MNILRVTGKNFLPYKEIDIDFSKEGVYGIVGKTGSGKSTIREIISWVLFGKSRTDGAGDELIHNDEETMEGIVEFEKDSKKYRVTRIRTRNKETNLTIEEVE